MKKLKPEERTWSTARRVVVDIRMFLEEQSFEDVFGAKWTEGKGKRKQTRADKE